MWLDKACLIGWTSLRGSQQMPSPIEPFLLNPLLFPILYQRTWKLKVSFVGTLPFYRGRDCCPVQRSVLLSTESGGGILSGSLYNNITISLSCLLAAFCQILEISHVYDFVLNLVY